MPALKTERSNHKMQKMNFNMRVMNLKINYQNILDKVGFEKDAVLRRLLYEFKNIDDGVISREQIWSYAYQLSSYVVCGDDRTTYSGNMIHPRQVSDFIGLETFLVERRISVKKLLIHINEDTANYFGRSQAGKVQIYSFLSAFCAFLYAFLPDNRKHYRVLDLLPLNTVMMDDNELEGTLAVVTKTIHDTNEHGSPQKRAKLVDIVREVLKKAM